MNIGRATWKSLPLMLGNRDVIQRLPNWQSIVQDVADLDLRDCEATILAVFYIFLYMSSVWSTDAKLLNLLFHL